MRCFTAYVLFPSSFLTRRSVQLYSCMRNFNASLDLFVPNEKYYSIDVVIFATEIEEKNHMRNVEKHVSN